MRNPTMFTIAILLLSHVTWAQWQALEKKKSCGKEDELIRVCGQNVAATKCRGTCPSLSEITMNFPYYKTKCDCCKARGWWRQVITCTDGSTQDVYHAKDCSCQECYGA